MSSSSSCSPRSSRCCSIRWFGRSSGSGFPAASQSRSCTWLFASALVLVILAVATAVVSQTKTAANRFNDYFTNPQGASGQTSAYRDVNRLQAWLDSHHLKSLKIEKSGHGLVHDIQKRDVGKYTHRIVTFVEGAAVSIGKTLFELVLLIVVSIYMLLDMQRLGRVIDRRFPPRPGELPLLRSI